MDQQENRKNVLRHLGQLGVDYAITEHPAVYTIEEMLNSGIKLMGEVCKNLFLRDSAGKRHFLVTIPNDKKAPLKILQQKLGTSRLSFASETPLARYLKLHKGEVTPFGILNDEGRRWYLIPRLRATHAWACTPMTTRQRYGFLLQIYTELLPYTETVSTYSLWMISALRH